MPKIFSESIRKIDSFRKEDRIAEILSKRGEHPGLVHIFSAMETCHTFQPWHDKQTSYYAVSFCQHDHNQKIFAIKSCASCAEFY